MLFAEHIVVHVVGRSHFEATCAEVDVNVVILDDRYFTVDQRHYHFFASEVLILGIIWVDAHSGVTHDGLRACGRYYGVAFLAHNLIAEIVELAVLLLVDYLDVRKCGLGFGVPVDHALATIYQAFAVEVDKHTDYAA